jgi:hypothetical protein
MSAALKTGGDKMHHLLKHAVASDFSVAEKVLSQGKWGEDPMASASFPRLL